MELHAGTGNLASNQVAVAAGFPFGGTRRNAGQVREGRIDLHVYSLIPADLEPDVDGR